MTDSTLRSTVWTIYRFGSASIIGSFILSSAAAAQNTIIPDASLGNEPSVVTSFDSTTDLITGGAVREQNLFHSFEEFSIGDGHGAYFITEPDTITNIFARITGGNISEIQGVLGIWETDFTTSNANLFLINPNGVVFGENAVLDVGGSFAATTAGGVQFGDAGSFSAVNPEAPSSVLTIDPSAYFFNQLPIGEITSRSIQSDLIDGTTRGLRVPNGETLTLLGGNTKVDGGHLHALGGRIELGAVQSSGVVSLEENGGLNFPKTLLKGDVSIANAFIDVSLDNAGDIAITADNVHITEVSLLSAGIRSGLGSLESQAGDIVIQATGNVRVDLSFISNRLDSNTSGAGGDVQIAATNLEMLNGALLVSSTSGFGNAGNVILTLSDTARLEGFFSGASSEVGRGGEGMSGDIRITAIDLEVLNGARLDASNSGIVNAGNVLLNITDTARFEGSGSIASSSIEQSGVGEGGNVEIIATNLEVLGGARLDASLFGSGRAGNVILTLSDTARFEGVDLSDLGPANGSGAYSNIGLNGQGNGGEVRITAANLEMLNGAQLGAGVLGLGDAGSVIVTLSDTARFEGINPLQNNSPSGALSTIQPGREGTGGDVQITAANVKLLNGARLSTENFGAGNAGMITLNLKNQLIADNGTIATTSSQGSGGQIDISAGSVVLSGDSDIQTSVLSGTGGGGSIAISADFLIALDDSDIFAFAADGRGGDINLGRTTFFGQNVQSSLSGTDPRTLDGNDRADINASGGLASGAVRISSDSFVDESLAPLPEALASPEQFLARSCIARSDDDPGSFVITGGGGLPTRPGDMPVSIYSTGDVQNLLESAPQALWRPGDPIVEPTGVFLLADGRLVLSQECDEN